MDILKLQSIIEKSAGTTNKPHIVAHRDQTFPSELRSPLDPITINNSHALMAITVGAMLNEVSAEQYLLGMIDADAVELHEELGRGMIRPWREMTPEEYAAYLAHQQ